MEGVLGSLCFIPPLPSTAPMTLSKGYPLSSPHCSHLSIVGAGPNIPQGTASIEMPPKTPASRRWKTHQYLARKCLSLSTPWPGPAEPTRGCEALTPKAPDILSSLADSTARGTGT